MKELSLKIYNAAKDPAFEMNLNDLENNLPKLFFKEITSLELCENIKQIINLIVLAGDNDLIDEIPFYKRENIFKYLAAIKTNLATMRAEGFNVKNQNANNLFQHLSTNFYFLQDNFESSFPYEKVTGAFDFKKENESILEIKTLYIEALKNAESFHSLKSNCEKLSKEVDDIQAKMLSFSKDSKNIYTESKANSDFITKSKEVIDTLLGKIKEIEQEVENRKLKINSFHSNINELEAKNRRIEEQMSIFMEDTKKQTTNIIKKHGEESDHIINEITKQQKQVDDILQGASAGELFKAFELRKTQVERDIKKWLWGIIGTTLGVVGLAIWLVTAISVDATINALFFAKVATGIPLILLDIFLINQYNSRKNLVEEYAFKSAMSLSFLAYKEVVDEMEHNTDGMKFVIETVQKIYESPFDKQKLSRKQIKNVERYMNKGVEIAEKLTNKK